ncbi:MAG: hypothetical protein L0228_01755 [Planctomycetes bacterium]|nr:hypothetical protein [Planctomycetota bacterium]
MLPKILDCARAAFRDMLPEAREEAVEETVARALTAYVRLVELNKTSVAHPSVLARYAIAQVRSGRQVGGHLNCRDVLSSYAQAKNGIRIEHLDRFVEQNGEWKEALVEDRRAGPAETAAARIDVDTWLRSLSKRNRRIAVLLAKGEATSAVAKRFGLTAGRISQKRQEFHSSWRSFQAQAFVLS